MFGATEKNRNKVRGKRVRFFQLYSTRVHQGGEGTGQRINVNGEVIDTARFTPRTMKNVGKNDGRNVRTRIGRGNKRAKTFLRGTT